MKRGLMKEVRLEREGGAEGGQASGRTGVRAPEVMGREGRQEGLGGGGGGEISLMCAQSVRDSGDM